MTALYCIFAITVLAGFCAAAEPLSIEKLQKIIKSEHDDAPLVKALQVYPKAREYNITVTNQTPDGQKFEGKALATEKWVEGKYIVSEIRPAELDLTVTLVVGYDEDRKAYRKYVVMGGKLTGYQVGTRVGVTRSISWIDLSQMKFEQRMDNLSIETHTDKKTVWEATFFQNGILQRLETGVAVVVK